VSPVTPSTVVHRITEKCGRLSLDDIRNDLIRMEETIIFGLIERSQFAHNQKIYMKGSGGGVDILQKSSDSNGHSFMECFLLETEKLHAMHSRYQCPDEHPFFPGMLPQPVLPGVAWPQVLAPNSVNANSRIMGLYVNRVVPQICRGGVSTEDEQYGSTAQNDISLLQAISRRVHFGKYVAEAKFQSETEKFTRLIEERNTDGMMEALTYKAVEERLLRRIRQKAQTFGSEVQEEGPVDKELKVDPEVIVEVYRDFIIPLTKDVEVEYLLQRCGPLPVACKAGA
jgi:chorismate mutase